MNLTPTELERLTIFVAADLARRYRGEGIRLSHPEAVALICDEVMTAAKATAATATATATATWQRVAVSVAVAVAGHAH